MGALRIKRTYDDLLQQVIIDRSAAPVPKYSPFLRRPSLVAAILVVAGLALAVTSAVFWRLSLAESVVAEEPFVYFEIKAIGPDGRAVAGAIVTSAGSEMGTTDSFGEWRRFVRVKLGASLPVQLSKVQAGETIAAMRNLAIPKVMPDAGALSIKGRIEMLRVGPVAISAVQNVDRAAAIKR